MAPEDPDPHAFDVLEPPQLTVDVLGCMVCCGWALAVEDPIDVGCNGWLNCVELGVRDSNRPRSGVTVRKLDCCCAFWIGGLVGLLGGGVDHENAGACGVLAPDLLAGPEDMVDGCSSQLGNDGLVTLLPLGLPLTRASKSSSVAPFASKAVPVTPPNDMKSSFAALVEPLVLPDSS